ncbi:MAG: flagellar hook protein FlgE [Rhizobacter sp.]
MSFQQGLSGLNTTAKNLEVIGNNIANANTFGAKAARAEFSEMYANAASGTANSVGIGVSLAAVSQQFTQGNITATDNPLDIAINGQGFFQVSNVVRSTDTASLTAPRLDGVPQYSRNGEFKTDKQGYIVNNQGQVLLGYGADGTGALDTSKTVPLQLPTGGIKASATTTMGMQFNLDSRLPAKIQLPAATPPVPIAIDFNDPTTYNNSTSMTAYDSNGRGIPVTYYFQKVGNNTWDVYATANKETLLGTAPVAPATAVTPLPVATISFPTDGGNPTGGDSTASPAVPGYVTFHTAPTPTGTVTDTEEADAKGVFTNIPSLTLKDGVTTTNELSGIVLDLSKVTQYAAAFGVTDLSQNGNRPGDLAGVSVSANGTLMARYSNGVTRAAGQLELANFRNPQGLQPVGGNAWASTFASGEPILNIAGNGGMGALQSGALEESNVDLTAELVSMITAQRAYQANAQTIKTQDQVLQTLVNLR